MSQKKREKENRGRENQPFRQQIDHQKYPPWLGIEPIDSEPNRLAIFYALNVKQKLSQNWKGVLAHPLIFLVFNIAYLHRCQAFIQIVYAIFRVYNVNRSLKLKLNTILIIMFSSQWEYSYWEWEYVCVLEIERDREREKERTTNEVRQKCKIFSWSERVWKIILLALFGNVLLSFAHPLISPCHFLSSSNAFPYTSIPLFSKHSLYSSVSHFLWQSPRFFFILFKKGFFFNNYDGTNNIYLN